MQAVREMLAEGAFQGATVADVAERAGVSRATLYQHFGSRLGLVDGLCDTLAANPALQAVREAVDLDEFLDQTVRFWESEEAVHRHLYGLAVLDPAAASFVARQREDRRGEVERLARKLHRAKALRPGLSERQAAIALMVLTSFAAYEELRESGVAAKDVAGELRRIGRDQVLAR